MTTRKIEQVTETIEHSFEQVLEVPPNTTEIEKTRVTSELGEHIEYDDKDVEIEEDIVDIQDRALELYEYLVDEIDDAEPSKRSRLVEVAGQILNTALTAAEKRRLMKKDKDILVQKDKVISGKVTGGVGGTTNILVASHEAVTEMLLKRRIEREQALSPSDPSVVNPPIENT